MKKLGQCVNEMMAVAVKNSEFLMVMFFYNMATNAILHFGLTS